MGLERYTSVGPKRRLDVTVGGVRVQGEPGAFRTKGTIVIQAVKANVGGALTGPASGIDVSLVGTSLRKKLTVTYPVARVPKGAKPVVLHQEPDGSWTFVKAKRKDARHVVVRTKAFSNVVTGTLAQWGRNIKGWAKSLGDRAASMVGGRTSPLTCGRNAPKWFGFDQRSDFVHVCSITNDGRAEIQIKSNRGITLDIRIPGDPDYVWVEDQDPALREGMGTKYGFDYQHRVLLGPGDRMTVGYRQPASAMDGQFSIVSDSAWAFIDDINRAVLDSLLGEVLDRKGLTTTATLWAWFQCGAQIAPRLTGGVAGDAATPKEFGWCMLQSLFDVLKNPAVLQRVPKLDKATAARLIKVSKSLSIAGTLVDLYPLFQATALHDIDDSLRSLLKGGNDTVSIWMDGIPVERTPNPVPVPDPVPVPVPDPKPDPKPNPKPGDSPKPTPTPARVDSYSNYGPANAGRAMCRGNPGVPSSMPGGVATQNFVVPSGVATIDTALVQIDPDSRVTATAVMYVNGGERARASAVASGDTRFGFPSFRVAPGDNVALQISFSSSFGKIITVYTAGSPGGSFSASNGCSAGAASFSITDTGLRAVVSGSNV